ANPESALFLGFNEALPQVELNLAFYVFEESSGPGTSRMSQCGLPETKMFPSARIAWESWNGSAWQSLGLLKDETRALTTSGHVHLKLPAGGVRQQAKFGDIDHLYWIRGRLERSSYERAPKLLTVRTNTISALQAET